MGITGESLEVVAVGLSDIIASASAARLRAQEAVELLEKSYKLQNRLCQYAANLARSYQVEATMEDLASLPQQIADVERVLVDKETELSTLKYHDLREAEEELQLAELTAMTTARAEGLIDGKNAEIRKEQSDALLAEDAEVQTAKAAVDSIQYAIAALQGEIDLLKVDANKLSNQFRGLIYAAQLRVEMLRIMGRAAID